MKFHLPRRRLWRVAIYLVSTLLILLAIDLIFVQAGRHITPKYATTRITEPTLPDGRIDYFAALDQHYGAGVTPENNALVPMIEATGPLHRDHQPSDWLTARLGMPPLPGKGDYFKNSLEPVTGFPLAAKEDDPAVDLEPLMARPWTGAEHPRMAAWLSDNEKPLAKLTEATRRPRYFFPFNANPRPDTLAGILLPHLAPLRNIGRALVCRAMLKAGHHDIAGARDDLMTVHRLAQRLGQGSTFVDRLVGLAIDNIADTAEVSLATDGTLDAAQARAWAADMRQLPPLFGFADAIDLGERDMFLDLLQLSAKKGLKTLLDFCASSAENHPWSQLDKITPLAPMQYDRAMEVGNGWYDRMAAAATQPAGKERRDALAAVEKDFDAFVAKTMPWDVVTSSDWPIAIFAPAIFKLTDRLDRTQAKRNLALTAMLLAAYHAEHDTYPATLDVLRTTDLAEIPADPFSDKPLVYRVAGDAYLLYSVGPNETDDGGVDAKGKLPTIPPEFTPSPPGGNGTSAKGQNQAKTPDDIAISAGRADAKRP